MSTTNAETPSRVERAAELWLAAACLMVAGLVVVVPAWLVDPRTLDGVSVWDKPMKFWASIGLHFLTLALLARLVVSTRRAGSTVLCVAYLSVGAGLFEVVYITAQAARGRASHFNHSTVYESVMYAAMGVGALVLVGAAFVLGLVLIRQMRKSARSPATADTPNPSGLTLGAALGLTLGPVLTVIIAGFISVYGSHYYGTSGSDAGGVPLFGWSTTLPDLRPAHFAALHLMQALPLAGLIADRVVPLRAPTVVMVATILGTALAIGMFVIALAGYAPLGILAAGGG